MERKRNLNGTLRSALRSLCFLLFSILFCSSLCPASRTQLKLKGLRDLDTERTGDTEEDVLSPNLCGYGVEQSTTEISQGAATFALISTEMCNFKNPAAGDLSRKLKA